MCLHVRCSSQTAVTCHGSQESTCLRIPWQTHASQCVRPQTLQGSLKSGGQCVVRGSAWTFADERGCFERTLGVSSSELYICMYVVINSQYTDQGYTVVLHFSYYVVVSTYSLLGYIVYQRPGDFRGSSLVRTPFLLFFDIQLLDKLRQRNLLQFTLLKTLLRRTIVNRTKYC